MHREERILASAARTATTTVNIALSEGRGMVLFVDVTARTGSTTLTPKLSIKAAGVSDTIDLWVANSAIDSADTTVAYLFYPGVGIDKFDAYTERLDTVLPPNLTLTMTHSDADGITYSVTIMEMM